MDSPGTVDDTGGELGAADVEPEHRRTFRAARAVAAGDGLCAGRGQS
jgi:hypothetical protein